MTYDKAQIKRELRERNVKSNNNFRRTLRAMYRDNDMFTCKSLKEINEKYIVGTMIDGDELDLIMLSNQNSIYGH